jgi:hypothetical protein
MLKKCLNCGSNDILPELKLLTEETVSGNRPVYVKLVEPKPAKSSFMWIPGEEKSHFYASICGQCGFSAIFAVNNAELFQASKKGYLDA